MDLPPLPFSTTTIYVCLNLVGVYLCGWVLLDDVRPNMLRSAFWLALGTLNLVCLIGNLYEWIGT